MVPPPPSNIGQDLGSRQLHNEKLLISIFFAAVSGNKEHGHKMVESFGHHLASIMTRPINMEHIIPTPPSITFNHGDHSVNSSHPSALSHISETGTSKLCHSSVGSVVSTPHRGKGTDLSCSVQAAPWMRKEPFQVSLLHAGVFQCDKIVSNNQLKFSSTIRPLKEAHKEYQKQSNTRFDKRK